MKKVTAEIFFSAWGEEKQVKEFDSEKEFEKFIFNLKKTKDSMDCIHNRVKSLWKKTRYGTYPNGTSKETLKYSAIIQ